MSSPYTRYTIGLGITMALYVAILFASIWLIKTYAPTGPLLYLTAIAPALPIGGSILVFLRFIDDVDEYVRAITIRRFVTATGLTLFICTAWGFLSSNADVPAMPLYLVYAMFWALYGFSCAFVRQAK